MYPLPVGCWKSDANPLPPLRPQNAAALSLFSDQVKYQYEETISFLLPQNAAALLAHVPMALRTKLLIFLDSHQAATIMEWMRVPPAADAIDSMQVRALRQRSAASSVYCSVACNNLTGQPRCRHRTIWRRQRDAAWLCDIAAAHA